MPRPRLPLVAIAGPRREPQNALQHLALQHLPSADPEQHGLSLSVLFDILVKASPHATGFLFRDDAHELRMPKGKSDKYTEGEVRNRSKREVSQNSPKRERTMKKKLPQ